MHACGVYGHVRVRVRVNCAQVMFWPIANIIVVDHIWP